MACYTPKYIKPYELVPKDLYEMYEKQGRTDKLLWQFNPLVLITADRLRERYGAVTINTWHSGGNLSQRGLRTDSSVGSPLSLHRRGAALDCNFKNATAAEVRADMEKLGCFKAGFKNDVPQEGLCFEHINRIEVLSAGKPITWFHFDIANCYNVDGSIMKVNG
jgi:hypothetical protein